MVCVHSQYQGADLNLTQLVHIDFSLADYLFLLQNKKLHTNSNFTEYFYLNIIER
jgi:hypothetical protein